jgi:hypothetical protein
MRTNLRRTVRALALPVTLALACSATEERTPFTTTNTSSTGTGGTGGAASSSSTGQGLGGGVSFDDAGQQDSGFIYCVPGGPDDDVDGDGWTPAQGDCDDCDPNVNPNAVELPGILKDANCDGIVDNVIPPCDMGLDIASLDPLDAVKAVDICKTSNGMLDNWGIVSADWVMADGSPPPTTEPQLDNFHLGHGILTKFGSTVKVQRGNSMLALSSGTARQPTDPGYQDVSGFVKDYTGNSPMGFPKESPACPGVITGQVNDPTAVELTINTPSNVAGFSFDFDFFTYEWPDYICSPFNDFFVAILSPIPMGQMDGNISFDSMGNPVSVNNAFLDVCGCPGNPPFSCHAGGKTFPCSLGDLDLLGTGFGFDTDPSEQDHGSTGWLRTTAPVAKNSQIVLRWAVYDSTDGVLDTSTLVDNFQWIANAGVVVVTAPQ